MAKYTPTETARQVSRVLDIDGTKVAWGGKYKLGKETLEPKEDSDTDAYFDKFPKATKGKGRIAKLTSASSQKTQSTKKAIPAG